MQLINRMPGHLRGISWRKGQHFNQKLALRSERTFISQGASRSGLLTTLQSCMGLIHVFFFFKATPLYQTWCWVRQKALQNGKPLTSQIPSWTDEILLASASVSFPTMQVFLRSQFPKLWRAFSTDTTGKSRLILSFPGSQVGVKIAAEDNTTTLPASANLVWIRHLIARKEEKRRKNLSICIPRCSRGSVQWSCILLHQNECRLTSNT